MDALQKVLLDRILKTFNSAGIICSLSKRTGANATYYNLILPANFHGKEIVSKLKVSNNDDEVLISSRNYNYSLWFHPGLNYAQHHSNASQILQICELLERYKVLGPKMSCYQYAGYLFLKNHPEWVLYHDNKAGHSIYTQPSTEKVFIIDPLFVELRDDDKDHSQRRIRIEYRQKLQDNFWVSTHSKRLSDILFFLDEYKELDELLKPLNPQSINSVFRPIL